MTKDEALKHVQSIRDEIVNRRDTLIKNNEDEELIVSLTINVDAIEIVLKQLKDYIKVSKEDYSYHTH